MNKDFKSQTTGLVTLFPFRGEGKVNDRLRLDTRGLSNSVSYTLVYDGSTGLTTWKNVDSAGVDTLYSSDGTIPAGDRAVTVTDGALSFQSVDTTMSIGLNTSTGKINIDAPEGIFLNGVKKYVALLSQTAPSTATSGSLTIGETYTLTTYVAGDDFSNVADVQSGTMNTDGCVFIATSATPTDWTHGSTLDSAGNPIATVLENTLGGTVAYAYAGIGIYTATLANAFTANKTVVVLSGNGGVIGHNIDSTSQITIYSQNNAGDSEDEYIQTAPFEIRVYP